MDAAALEAMGFSSFEFKAGKRSRRVFAKGVGPGVVLIHEMPGISQEVADLGSLLVGEGFRVWMPYLFDPPGKQSRRLDGWSSAARACVSGEFYLLNAGGTSRVTVWLRALARHLHSQDRRRPGVGVIGMCFSGGFALAAVLEPSVLAPVMSQPSLPIPITRRRRRAFGLSPSDAIIAGTRIDDEGLCVLGLRFTSDRWSPRPRFERLQEVLGARFEAIEIPSGTGVFDRNAHSVLTRGRKNREDEPHMKAAVERVVAFLHERLD